MLSLFVGSLFVLFFPLSVTACIVLYIDIPLLSFDMKCSFFMFPFDTCLHPSLHSLCRVSGGLKEIFEAFATPKGLAVRCSKHIPVRNASVHWPYSVHWPCWLRRTDKTYVRCAVWSDDTGDNCWLRYFLWRTYLSLGISMVSSCWLAFETLSTAYPFPILLSSFLASRSLFAFLCSVFYFCLFSISLSLSLSISPFQSVY